MATLLDFEVGDFVRVTLSSALVGNCEVLRVDATENVLWLRDHDGCHGRVAPRDVVLVCRPTLGQLEDALRKLNRVNEDQPHSPDCDCYCCDGARQ